MEELAVSVRPPPGEEGKKKAAAVGVGKTRVKGKPRRRKSTLTPDELEKLMMLS